MEYVCGSTSKNKAQMIRRFFRNELKSKAPQHPRPTTRTGRRKKTNVGEVQQRARFKVVTHKCKTAFLIICVIAAAIVILVRLSVLLLPAQYCWLTDAQIAHIDEFFFHGTIGAIVAGYLGKHLKNN
jgi:hypothetical protein